MSKLVDTMLGMTYLLVGYQVGVIEITPTRCPIWGKLSPQGYVKYNWEMMIA